MPWKIYVCDRCKSDKFGGFTTVMLKDELWLKIAGDGHKKEAWCFACMQQALDRPITFDDLKPGVLTREFLLGALIGHQTPNIEERLTPDFLATV